MKRKWRRTVRKAEPTAAIAPMPLDRPEKAAALQSLIGEPVCLTWGMGSQQTKHATEGTLRSLTARYALLEIGGQAVIIPLGWIIRYSQ